jgi:hypothetical protein
MMMGYARLLKEFQQYDRSDIGIEKMERFTHYINEQSLFYKTLQDILKDNKVDIDNNKRTILSNYEVNYLNKAISFIIKRERLTTSAIA